MRRQRIECDASKIFCCWDPIQHHGFVSWNAFKEGADDAVLVVNQKRMVPGINDLPFRYRLNIREVEHHAFVGDAVCSNRFANQRDLDGVTMTMEVSALAGVVRNSMAGVEFKATGNFHQ